MKVGVLGAMIEEVGFVEERLKNTSKVESGKRSYISGKLNGAEELDVTVVFSRMGKVSSASTATTLINKCGVDFILFIGLAGGANPDLNIGDVVVGSELIQHDVDASAIPVFKKYEIPLLNRKSFFVDSKHSQLAKDCAERFFKEDFRKVIPQDVIEEFHMEDPKVSRGLIASGDQFIANPDKLQELRNDFPGLQCVEMEGAAVAQVCFEHDVPCCVIRIISDKADHSAVIDFSTFVSKASSVMSGSIACDFLKGLAKLD